MAQKRAQIGMELMVIVGAMLLLMLPLIAILLVKGGEFAEKAAVAKLSEDAGRIAGTVDNLGRMGPGSKATLQVDVPNGVSEANANSAGEFWFTLETRYGQTQLVKLSSFPLQIDAGSKASLQRPGTHLVTIDYPVETLDKQILITAR